MTQEDLEKLPEVFDVVLWQPDEEAPICVRDVYGVDWNVGLHKGILSKCRKKTIKR